MQLPSNKSITEFHSGRGKYSEVLADLRHSAVDISGIDPVDLLCELWKNQIFETLEDEFCWSHVKELDRKTAQESLQEGYIVSIKGKNIGFESNSKYAVLSILYDKTAGKGKFQEVVDALRRH